MTIAQPVQSQTGSLCQSTLARVSLSGFRINNDAQIRIIRFGSEQQPLLVVDDFLEEPDSLRDYAAEQAEFKRNKDFYPGIKAAVPDDYSDALCNSYEGLLARIYAPENRAEAAISECSFAISTQAAEDLLPIQCIPHFDSGDNNQIAMVHYLCGTAFGGTSFYRHRKTGYESVDQKRLPEYQRCLSRQATTSGLPPKAYINGSTDLFEKLYEVEARYNRAIFYRSTLFHSGNINPEAGLSADPRRGRLTVTSSIGLNNN